MGELTLLAAALAGAALDCSALSSGLRRWLLRRRRRRCGVASGGPVRLHPGAHRLALRSGHRSACAASRRSALLPNSPLTAKLRCPIRLNSWKRASDSIRLREELNQPRLGSGLCVLPHVKCSHLPIIAEPLTRKQCFWTR